MTDVTKKHIDSTWQLSTNTRGKQHKTTQRKWTFVPADESSIHRSMNCHFQSRLKQLLWKSFTSGVAFHRVLISYTKQTKEGCTCVSAYVLELYQFTVPASVSLLQLHLSMYMLALLCFSSFRNIVTTTEFVAQWAFWSIPQLSQCFAALKPMDWMNPSLLWHMQKLQQLIHVLYSKLVLFSLSATVDLQRNVRHLIRVIWSNNHGCDTTKNWGPSWAEGGHNYTDPSYWSCSAECCVYFMLPALIVKTTWIRLRKLSTFFFCKASQCSSSNAFSNANFLFATIITNL